MLVGQGWMDAKLLFAGHVWVGGGLQCNLSGGEICGRGHVWRRCLRVDACSRHPPPSTGSSWAMSHGFPGRMLNKMQQQEGLLANCSACSGADLAS